MVSQLTLLALASSAAALMITSPGQNVLWDLTQSNTIEWNSVNTDPQTFDIYLSHMASHPPTNTLLAADQNRDAGSFVVRDLQLPNGRTYQINFVAQDRPEQIYAQSQQFNITGEAIAATATLPGYTGPAYVPTTSPTASPSATQTSSTPDNEATNSASSVTRTTLQTFTTTSSGTVLTQTTSAVTTGNATGTGAQPTNAGAATTSPAVTPNAAIGNSASAPLAALVFGIAAFFL